MTDEQEPTVGRVRHLHRKPAPTKVLRGRRTDLKATGRYCRHQQRRPEDVTFQVEEGPIHDSAHHDIGVVRAELDQVILRRPGQWQ